MNDIVRSIQTSHSTSTDLHRLYVHKTAQIKTMLQIHLGNQDKNGQEDQLKDASPFSKKDGYEISGTKTAAILFCAAILSVGLGAGAYYAYVYMYG